MSTPIPPPLRAAAGLAALAIDSARKLPEQLVGLPVLAVSAALQVSLKAQQRYAELVARGDEVLGQLRPAAEEAPPWAHFDDEPAAARPRSAFEAAPDPGDESFEEALGAALAGGGAPLGEAPLDGGPVGAEPLGEALLEQWLEEQAAGLMSLGDAGADRLADAEVGLGGGADLDEPALDGPALGGGADLDGPALGGGADLDGPALGGGPGTKPDGVAVTEAQAGGLDVGELHLAGPGGGEDPDVPAVPPVDAAREPDSGTEPGVDLPAGGVVAMGADAEVVGAALTAGADAGTGADVGTDTGTSGGTDPAAEDDPVALDGYLTVEPPVARYDEMSIPQLRGRLRSFTETQVEELVAYERATASRPPYLTMLENRLVTLRSR